MTTHIVLLYSKSERDPKWKRAERQSEEEKETNNNGDECGNTDRQTKTVYE